ncbi:MAG: class I adenylate-forming enzyme family protein [Actinomycetaceae bacterium]|nr:class I adenylate-forming enzyme family protein [Actinomycetaceae bacterium]
MTEDRADLAFKASPSQPHLSFSTTQTAPVQPDFSPLNLLLKAAIRNPHRLHLVGVAPRDKSIFTPFLPAQTALPATASATEHFQINFASTIAQSAELTLKLVSLLKRAGVQEKDRVALWGPNSVWHLLVHIACAGLGAISVQLDQHYTAEEFAVVASDCSPKLVFAGPAQQQRAADTLDGFTWFSLAQIPQLLESLPAASQADLPLVDDSVVGAIIYTSGTASHPKGVALTHANLWWGCRNFREVFEYSSDFVEAVVAPLSHIGGFNGTTLDLVYSGGTVVVVESFHPGAVLEILEAFRVQMMFGVPTIYLRLLAEPSFSTRDLSAFVRPLIGGSSLPAALAQQMHAVGWAPYNVWGMTEQSASGTCLTPGMAPNCENGVGIPFPYTQVKVARLDKDSALLAGTELVEASPNEVGMLVCSGPSVSAGYWQDEALNSASFVGKWLLTGDLGFVDQAGSFHFAARAAHTINTGGEKVLPDPVAETLHGIPGVGQVQVVGIPDPQWGQLVAAVIIPDNSPEGAHLRSLPEATVLEILRTEAAKSLARYKLPRAVKVVEAFPVSSNGKVSYPGLQELFN